MLPFDSFDTAMPTAAPASPAAATLRHTLVDPLVFVNVSTGAQPVTPVGCWTVAFVALLKNISIPSPS